MMTAIRNEDAMMRNVLLLAMTSLFFCASAEAAFVCPVKAVGTNAEQDRAIAAAIPAGDAFADVTKLNTAVTALRAKGVSNAALVDSLIASYCPAVARNTALTDQQKQAQVRRFASRVVALVYTLESADAVILDVPLPPAVAAAVNARAAAEKISPETWVAKAVERDLKAAR
jgi:hypothetical protein